MQNTQKVLSTPSASTSYTLKFILKRRKNRPYLHLRLLRAEKMGYFCQFTRFCPSPSGKIPEGAHVRMQYNSTDVHVTSDKTATSNLGDERSLQFVFVIDADSNILWGYQSIVQATLLLR